MIKQKVTKNNLTLESPLKAKISWSSINDNKGSYLKADLLTKYGFDHCFFTRRNLLNNPEQLIGNLRDGLSIHFNKQIHSNRVIRASQTNSTQQKKADSLISDQRNQSLWVYSADCIPIMIANPKDGKVAICHAGWRGIAGNILSKTINRIDKDLTNRKFLLVALGPAISKSKYEVDLHTANKILASLQREKKLDFIGLQKLVSEPKLKDIISSNYNKEKFNIDIRLAVLNQLTTSGIQIDQITICPLCTFSEPSLFYSWRRDKIRKTQWSVIASKN